MDKKNIEELLLYCLSKEADKTMAARLAQLSPSDWERFVQQSARHWVAPLLYQRMNTLETGKTIPANVVNRLREIYLSCALKNSLLYGELTKVLGALHDNNIPVIALKGIHLAEVVYGNIALRPMSDVDILVRKTDLSKVEEKLRDVGYAMVTYRKKNRTWKEENHYHLIFKPSNGGKLHLEVHWNVQRPTSPFMMDVDYFFDRAQPATIAGVEVLALSPEDLLLHLCINAAKDRFCYGLRVFCDISESIKRYQDKIDWIQLQERVSQWGARRPVYLILNLARELLGASVPEDVLEAIKPNGYDSQVETWTREQVFDKRESPPISKSNLKLWGLKRFRDKASYLLTRAFPPPRVMAMYYDVPDNSKHIYFYYPNHLKILLRRHAPSMWRLLRRDKKAMAKARRVNNLLDWMESN